MFFCISVVFYGDCTNFVDFEVSWALHGGFWIDGILVGEFSFNRNTGGGRINDGSRLL